jgi:orotidine-5'-phosphate decarboxylase
MRQEDIGFFAARQDDSRSRHPCQTGRILLASRCPITDEKEVFVGLFIEKLNAANAKGLYSCAGLDPLDAKIPPHLKKLHEKDPLGAWRSFLYKLVNVSADHVAAFKPNWAFFLTKGHRGLALLEDVCHLIKESAPNALLILDMKCGDIGDTNAGYVKFAFNVCKADAITVHPYMGWMAMHPFLADPNRGVFVLCRTSNPGAEEFQELPTRREETDPNRYLFEEIALGVAARWNGNRNCGLVAGATAPQEITNIRLLVPDMPLLIPGIGKQGGNLETTVDATRSGGSTAPFLVNQSSSFMYASEGEDFAKAARDVLRATDEQICAILRSPA